ncbi:cytochrome c [Aliifodinibius salicampi]|uniref:Cytochrome c n=1 Tax=Fodinibius salicampi TaxID=1920655 RepID=A0ABT3PZW5_9BACT|nr:cytochrome c [Fodinibius salicampi]MCW9713422.1 cytochrome c [Fodinibius salicampi]
MSLLLQKKVSNSVDTDNTTDTVTTEQADTLTTSAQRGKTLFEQHKCQSCHPIDGSNQLTPPLRGLYGNERKLKNDSTIVADEGYIKESIQYPGAKVVQGYNDNMPSFRDLMSDQELQEITDYIKALR